MNKLLKYSVLALALGLGSSSFAHASTATAIAVDGGLIGGILDILNPPPSNDNNGNCAPEVDPGLAISGLALLGGSLTVLRARRSTR